VWVAIRIAVFYGAPIIAVGAAMLYFALLFLRVRRGAVDGRKAALRYMIVLLLPFAAVLVIWAAGELSSYLASPEDFHWDAEASQAFLLSLLPLGAYVGAPIVALVAAFWATVALPRRTRFDV